MPLTLVGQRGDRGLSATVPPGSWVLRLSNQQSRNTDVRRLIVDPSREPATLPADSRAWRLYEKGREAASQHRWTSARAAFREARKVALEPFSRLFLDGYLAKTYEYQAQQQTAHRLYSRALRSARILDGEGLLTAWCLQRIAAMDLFMGRRTEARRRSLESLRIRELLAPETLLVADNTTFLGLLARDVAKNGDAEEKLRVALKILERNDAPPADLAAALDALAGLQLVRFDLRAAVPALERVLKIRQRETPGSRTEAIARIVLARAYTLDRRLGEAEDHLLEALRILKAITPTDFEQTALCLNSLGDVALKRGDWKAAEGFFLVALRSRRAPEPRSWEDSLSLGNLGHLKIKTGHLEEAERYFKAALRLLEQMVPDGDARALKLHSLGLVYRSTGRLELASHTMLEAVEVLERQIGNLGGSLESQRLYRSKRRAVFRAAISALLASGNRDEALEVLERYRKHDRLMRGSSDAGQRSELGALQREYDLLLEQYFEQRPLRAAERRRFEERTRLLRERIALLGTDGASSKALQKSATAEESPLRPSAPKGAIAAGTAVLSYVLDDENVYLFTFTGREVAVYRLWTSAAEL
ncbi:MAG: tetratricopeptide repeat protein, partial [Acidobacteriota bacterium]